MNFSRSIKARYKPTNRIEMHKWVEGEFGFEEQYLGDLIFSTNLSFIPVDVVGLRGDLYICDWYNPVKGHSQYALRDDDRRDRRSGRIWRVTTGAAITSLLNIETAQIEFAFGQSTGVPRARYSSSKEGTRCLGRET